MVPDQLKREGLLVTVLLLSPFLVSGHGVSADSLIIAGPWVDKVVYNLISDYNESISALLENEVDLIGEMLLPESLEILQASEAIETAQIPRNGYGYFAINCDQYPFNITAFRRAFAFALDKERICEEIWHGLADPQDSVVPRINPFSVEGTLPYNYYTSDLQQAGAILDAAGFDDVDSDDIREAPDGSDFDVLIEVPASSDLAIAIGEIAEDALNSIGIDANSEPTDFYEYINRLPYVPRFDIVFFGKSFLDYDLDWLAYEYWSEYADEPYWNFPNFRNSTYDSWRQNLLYAVDYEQVLEAIREMQRVLIYECPVVVCYENMILSAYRIDRFEGQINDMAEGVACSWTNLLVRRRLSEGGPLGGTFRWSTPLGIDTFNFMITSSAFTWHVLDELYDSLMTQDPEGSDILWLAESYTAETHLDNPVVPEGYTRFTFNLVRNATWTDGTPITAEDVAFTLNYYRDSPGHPYGFDLIDMTSAVAPYAYTVVVEFYTESIWHLHNFVYKPIIPQHVFVEVGNNGWNTWNPQPPTETMVTSGPFNVSDYVEGEFVELTKNPGYFKRINMSMIPPTTTNPYLSTIPVGGLSPIGLAVMVSSVIVIVAVLVKWELSLRK
jgi:ABC-type transport system substrate-binding protein